MPKPVAVNARENRNAVNTSQTVTLLKPDSVFAGGLASELSAETPQNVSPNDRIRVALIGNGIQGSGDGRQSVAAGAEMVAVADVYEGRLTKAKEVWGSQVFTTRDYREVLARK